MFFFWALAEWDNSFFFSIYSDDVVSGLNLVVGIIRSQRSPLLLVAEAEGCATWAICLNLHWHTDMESPEVTQTLTCQEDKQHGLMIKDIPTSPPLKASLLGKRHHSLYASLHGYEAEGLRKVSIRWESLKLAGTTIQGFHSLNKSSILVHARYLEQDGAWCDLFLIEDGLLTIFHLYACSTRKYKTDLMVNLNKELLMSSVHIVESPCLLFKKSWGKRINWIEFD